MPVKYGMQEDLIVLIKKCHLKRVNLWVVGGGEGRGAHISSPDSAFGFLYWQFDFCKYIPESSFNDRVPV